MALYAFDGTWNRDQEVDERDTNVLKFFQLSAEPNERKVYVPGVGSKLGVIGQTFGGAFGIGAEDRIEDAYKHLSHVWKPGEPIDVIGFSRGAATALDFVNKIVDRRHKLGAPQPPIRFLGLFDTVGSFGLPNVGPDKEHDFNFGHRLTLPRNDVTHCCHAMALDERRQAFGVTRVDGAREVWFRGCHSDVGGGNGNTKLSFIALRWMVRKAALCGVPIDRSRAIAMALDAGIDPNAPLKLPKDFVPNDFRRASPNDRVHYTVGPIASRSDKSHCNPFSFTVVETEADEAAVT